MADRDELEQLFLFMRGDIARLAAYVGRRLGLRGDDQDDFAAWVEVRFIENDYALVAKVREAGATKAYLAMVVSHQGQEYCAQRWGGRWRASAAARRLGPVAERLERLVYRDGMRLAEAAELLRTTGLTTLSDRELAGLLAECPVRTRGREDVGLDDVELPDDGRADDQLLDAEADDARRSLGARLAALIAALPVEDQALMRLRYWQGLSVADTARALGLLQKPLYRRLDRVLAWLRAELERGGVSREQIRTLLGAPLPELSDDGTPAPERPPPTPRTPRVGDARPPPSGDSEPPRPFL